MTEERHNDNSMEGIIKPSSTLAILLTIGLLCAGLMSIFPEEGIRVTDSFTLDFPTWKGILAEDTLSDPALENIEEFLESYTVAVDSTAILDSLEQMEIKRRQEMLKVQYAGDKNHPMADFFRSIDELKSGDRKQLRVMHYGDSQIEGDRITGYLRSEWQKELGGNGPGLLPGFEVVPSSGIDQENSGNWIRYTIFGKKDTLVPHERYGVLANFAQYGDLVDHPADSAWISLRPSRMGYARARKYSKLRIWLGQSKGSSELEVLANDSLIYTENLTPAPFRDRSIALSQTPDELLIKFNGNSPELYALSLESNSGVIVDNIGMRGSSGTIFKRIDRALLREQYAILKPSLLILQFGGNTVPYIESEEQAQEYGRWFKSQILMLREMLPQTSILVIGPSDMAIKDKDKYVTYPFLLEVRDALKQTALESGCGFWDLYEVMGGRNSMEVWVSADPPLAASDYVHFTLTGAKKVAELLHKSLMDEYETWKSEGK